MAISNETQEKLGLDLPARSDDFASAAIGGKVTPLVAQTLSKAEENLLQTNALNVEDNDIFRAFSTETGKGANLIVPTYDPVQLSILAQQNNTLLQCVSAMEVNVDGTGYCIERADGEPVDDADKNAIAEIKEFFDEPYPGVSFTTLRRKLRRDIENTGNGYLEVIRNIDGEIVFINYMEAILSRMVKLDEPVLVEETVNRLGGEVTVKVWKRERRFAQKIGRKLVYFKEFGASRNLHRETGEWEGSAKQPEPIEPQDQATEVFHFTNIKDVLTNYGNPRWVNNIPSVLGSRRAEEYNLEFFGAGGVPPVMILVQGGALSGDARAAITSYLAAPAKNKQRGVLAEVFSTSGDLGSAGNVKVSVERFGAERQNDAMFMKYDEATSEHVRVSFRLPPMFLGLAHDYTFATAYTSYMVAEAQVFAPERQEFDEFVNTRIMPEINPDYVFRSHPVSVTDVENKLKALTLCKDGAEVESWFDAINETANLSVIPMEGETPEEIEARVRQEVSQAATANGVAKIDIEASSDGSIKKMDDTFLLSLSNDWADHLEGVRAFDDAAVAAMKDVIKSMSPPLQKLFRDNVGLRVTKREMIDPDTTFDLLSAAGEME